MTTNEIRCIIADSSSKLNERIDKLRTKQQKKLQKKHKLKNQSQYIMGTSLLTEMSPDIDDVVSHTLPFLNEIDGQALAEATLSPNPQLGVRAHFLVHDDGVYRYKNCRYTYISSF